MNPKPETESEQIKRMLEFWYGDSSRGGPGKPNAAGSASSASSPAPTKESEKPITSPLASAFSNILRSGGERSPQSRQASMPHSAPAKDS